MTNNQEEAKNGGAEGNSASTKLSSKKGGVAPPYSPFRRLVRCLHVLLVVGLPFLKINGQSALRFDIPQLKLYFFGQTLWMNEFFLVLLASLFLTFLIVLITVIFGRIWCGWFCPQTVFCDLTTFYEKSLKRDFLPRMVGILGVFLLSLLLGANLIWYFKSPYEFLPELWSWRLSQITWGFWIVLTLITFLNFTLLRRRFCATICPYAKLQGMLFDDRTLIVAFDKRRAEECMDCKACVKVCPVGIDIRKGANIACINCAACIDTCHEIFQRKGKRGLIDYFWGEPELDQSEIHRPHLLIVGLLTLSSLIFLVYFALSLKKIDVTIIPDPNFPPKYTSEKEIVNAFLLSLENKEDVVKTLVIRASDNVMVLPGMVNLQPGELKRIRIFLRGGEKTEKVVLSFIPSSLSGSTSSKDAEIVKEVILIKP